MAESLAALGVAANILAFVDFGLKFASKAAEVYNSTHGMPGEVTDLDLVTKDLKATTAELKKNRKQLMTAWTSS